jgi:hypothetical protein
LESRLLFLVYHEEGLARQCGGILSGDGVWVGLMGETAVDFAGVTA